MQSSRIFFQSSCFSFSWTPLCINSTLVTYISLSRIWTYNLKRIGAPCRHYPKGPEKINRVFMGVWFSRWRRGGLVKPSPGPQNRPWRSQHQLFREAFQTGGVRRRHAHACRLWSKQSSESADKTDTSSGETKEHRLQELPNGAQNASRVFWGS